MNKQFNGIYKNLKVFITGHTGFKGSWLTYWLKELGANVAGYSLSIPTNPSLYELLNMNISSFFNDIRDIDKLKNALNSFKPDVIFHLAASSEVKYSYNNPITAFTTNINGTINLFEAVRSVDSVRAIVNVTSDKCYENITLKRGYTENDPLSGDEPYSASKACAEIITKTYRSSYFNLSDYGKSHKLLFASARAGNAIGGGDWANNRLIPDIITAASKNEKAIIRNIDSMRSWIHVFDVLAGYLLLGQKLFEGNIEFADAFNFGGIDEDCQSVDSVINRIKNYWNEIEYITIDKKNDKIPEASKLELNSTKANKKLKWKSVWNKGKQFEKTILWYKDYYEGVDIKKRSQDDLYDFIKDAQNNNLAWIRK